MKKWAPFSGQEPLLEDLNDYLQNQLVDALKERVSEFVQDGILHSVLGISNEFQVSVNGSDQTKIDIGDGVSYIAGERALISADENYDASRPSRVISGANAPGNIGNIGVPLASYTFGQVNYIWIQYLQIKDIAVYELHPISLQTFFVKDLDGYTFVINTTNNPATNPLANAVFVAAVTAQGPLQPLLLSGINYSNRTYALIKNQRVLITTPKADRSDATVDYGSEEDHELDDHIKAIGTGTVSAINPHGLSLADISGGSSSEPLNELYQKETHNNKVITTNPYSTLSAFYPQLVIVDPGDDHIDIYNLSITEKSYVNGKRFVRSSSLGGATVVQVSFTGQVTNTYYGYIDNNGNIQITSDYDNVIVALGYMPVFEVNWAPGIGNLTNPDDGSRTAKDLRIFIGENNTEVRFFDPPASEYFPGRRWLNLTDGQFKGIKDTVGTIVLLG
jgi:hypothetical protein